MQNLAQGQESQLVLEEVSKHFAGLAAVDRVNLSVQPSEFVTLLGPSGSGKTTVLRMIGGFIAPDGGRILIDGSDVARVPVERRPTAMLFQQLSLWPHLSVARNVSFGLELRRVPKAAIERRVKELLEVVGLADFGSRLPSQLSGGQQQRVALARALALEPRILLLDEPFSALDTKLRFELRTFVRTVQREVGTTTLLVTHDQEEALELSDRIVVMHDGRIEQIGTPTDIYDAPRSRFVGEFLGAMNFFSGSLRAEGVAVEGLAPIALSESPELRDGSASLLGVRPEDVIVEESARGPFRVEVVVVKGHYKEATLRAGSLSLRAYVTKDSHLEPGASFGVRLRKVHRFPGEPVISPGLMDAEGDRPLSGTTAGPAGVEPEEEFLRQRGV